MINQVNEVEVDEMWSFVNNKKEQCWFWRAIEHMSGATLAYVFGRRKDDVFFQLKTLLEPFGVTRFYTDGWEAYEHHLVPESHHPGKCRTQKIERTRVKRLARKTICTSKSTQIHDNFIGLSVNWYEFDRAV